MSGAGWRQFVANEVLTSTNVQNYLQDQTVMRFASASARDSAITSPSQGMIAFLDSTGVTSQYFSAGTGGRATAGWYPLGVQLVKSIAIGSAVSSVTVSGAFSADFDCYRIVIAGGVGSGNANLNLKLGSTTTGYYYGSLISAYGSGALVTNGGGNLSNMPNIGYFTTSAIFLDNTIINPYQNLRTSISSVAVSPYTSGGMGISGGFLDDANSYTSFTVTTSAGTITGGTIYVYGWSK